MAAQIVLNSVTAPYSWSLNTPKLSSSWSVVPSASRCSLPSIRRARSKFTLVAASNDGGESQDLATSSSPVIEEVETAPNAISEKRAKAEAEVKKGQRTAIVTGAISVALGIGYLLLIQLLDTRGVILVPPPPEAFDP